MNPYHHAILSTGFQPEQFVFGTPALSPSQTSLSSLYWPHIYLASEWPEFAFSKKYFILYSPDHGVALGGIWWGEFDNFDSGILNGFVERGKIKDGYQAETPFLVRIPTSKSGLASDEAFLYYHTVDEPGSQIRQETRLITSSGGGELHTVLWNDRGRPLGVNLMNESHTGYFRPFLRETGDYIGYHHWDGNVPLTPKHSIGTTGLSFTRQEGIVDPYMNMPQGNYFIPNQLQPFKYNGVLYGIFALRGTNQGIALAKLDDETFLPSQFITSLIYAENRDVRVFIENGIANCLIKPGSSANTTQPYYLWQFDLSEISI